MTNRAARAIRIEFFRCLLVVYVSFITENLTIYSSSMVCFQYQGSRGVKSKSKEMIDFCKHSKVSQDFNCNLAKCLALALSFSLIAEMTERRELVHLIDNIVFDKKRTIRNKRREKVQPSILSAIFPDFTAKLTPSLTPSLTGSGSRRGWHPLNVWNEETGHKDKK